jgi:DNA-binding SARP family transcriptional activator
MVEFRIFGAMEGEAGGGLLDLGPPKQRLGLAPLLVGAGRPVGLGTLIDRVWDRGASARTASGHLCAQ